VNNPLQLKLAQVNENSEIEFVYAIDKHKSYYKGNMYSFVTHTFNTVKGICWHNCKYCYMKRFHNQKEIHFDKSELKTNLGNGNFIFVGSSNDLFADNIDDKWILDTLKHCEKFKNKYLFQTKNPERLYKEYSDILSFNLNAVICTTIESNRIYPDISKIAPITKERAKYIGLLEQAGFAIYITAEPIMDFDLDEMVYDRFAVRLVCELFELKRPWKNRFNHLETSLAKVRRGGIDHFSAHKL
jgi:DNA repair photolyase